MKLHTGLSAKHLTMMLREALHKEQEQWKPKQYKIKGNGLQEVLGYHRDEVVSYLILLNGKFRFTPETVSLSIYLLDNFLQLVKVRPKYLHCVAISCFFIAAKILEEDEVIPGTVDLVKVSQCTCSVAEILRMEALILNKLNWNIKFVTAIDFLHIIHGMLMSYYPQLLDGLTNMTASKLLEIMTRKLFNCLSSHKFQAYHPSVLSLAVASLELEQLSPNWLSIVLMVQQMTQIDNTCLISCREMAERLLTERNLLPSHYQLLSSRSLKRNVSKKRKVEQVETEEEDFYDAIKRLYNEDVSVENCGGLKMSCSSEVMHQDSEGSSSLMQLSAEVPAV